MSPDPRIVYIVAMVAAIVPWATYASPSSVDEDKVELTYSGNETVCKPLAGLFDRLNHHHNLANSEGTSVETKLNWEDIHKSEFAAIGLIPATAVRDISYQYDGRREKWLAAFYALGSESDGHSKFIYLQDQPVGTHGGFGTNVWLLKPGVAIPAATVANTLADRPPGIGAKDIDVGILLPLEATIEEPYRVITGPYQFEAANTQISLGTGQVVQRIFKWRGETVIIARTLGSGVGVLYEISPELEMRDICRFVTDGMLEYLGQNTGELSK